MRDPDRIPEMLQALGDLWRKYPDLRLGQIIESVSIGDPFYMEDGAMLKRLLECLEEWD